MTPEPFYRPMKRGARIFWTLATIAAAWFATYHYIAAITAI